MAGGRGEPTARQAWGEGRARVGRWSDRWACVTEKRRSASNRGARLAPLRCCYNLLGEGVCL
eukprot:7212858-Pyramimonas_sp.AAC.1